MILFLFLKFVPGSAELLSVPGQGTEVELRLPKQAADGSGAS